MPVFKPYSYTINKELVCVIPVPMISPRWYIRDHRETNDKHQSSLWLHSPETSPICKTIKYKKEENNPEKAEQEGQLLAKELAKTLSALANTEGGTILFETKQEIKGKYFFDNFLWPALTFYCWPPPDPNIVSYAEDTKNQGWSVTVKHGSSEIHKVGEVIHRWKDGRVDGGWSLSKKETLDEIYDFIQERCKLDYPTIEARPVISYSYLKGPRFDDREQQGARYDPQREILKWTEAIPFQREPDEPIYQTALRLWINRPVELYRHRHLEGEIRTLFEDKLLSGLDLTYFNAFGRRVAPSRHLIIEKRSKVKIIFDHIALRSVFGRRRFEARRELKFEGINPEQDRLEDIAGMLADLGLEKIVMQPGGSRYSPYARGVISIERIMEDQKSYVDIWGRRPDGLTIKLHIKGEKTPLARKRKEESEPIKCE